MKGVTILLAGLMLMLGAGTALAANGAVGSSTAVASGHADPLRDIPGSRAALFLDTFLDDGESSGAGLLATRPMTVWDYAVSPQVSIDLECRPFAAQEYGFGFIGDGVDVKQVTQNLMLGFSYKF